MVPPIRSEKGGKDGPWVPPPSRRRRGGRLIGEGEGIRVRCPFRAQMPERYRYVTEHCTAGQSFLLTGPLR